jgi:HK97 family phage major capsid protein
VSVGYGTEFAVTTDGSAALTNPTITPAKGQGFVPISIEGAEDIAGIGGWIAQAFANARDDLDATKMATGSGTAEPKGVVTALAVLALNQDFNATNSAIVAADLFDIQTATGPQYRSRASWVMNLAYINRIRALGASDDYFAQTVRLPEGAFAELLGRPVYEASGLTATLSTGTNNWCVFGDFSNFTIVDRVGTTVEFIPHLFDPTTGRPNGSRGWYMHWRTGSDVVNTTALTLGVNPNTAYL